MVVQNKCERCGKEGSIGVDYYKRRWYLCGSCANKFVSTCQEFIKTSFKEVVPEKVTTGGIDTLKIEKTKKG